MFQSANQNKLNLLILISLTVWGLIIYFLPLHNSYFHFDDKFSIERNPVIQQLNVNDLFETFNTRFLVGISFAINYGLSGMDPFYFRLTNVLIHILNAFLVYILLKLILSLPSINSELKSRLKILPLFISFLFLSHPIQTETVNFITQRFVLLATFFYLWTLILYLQFDIYRKRRFYLGAILTSISAMFCKEFTVTLPVMIIVMDFCLFQKQNINLKPHIKRILPFLCLLLIIPLTLLNTSSKATGVANIAHSQYTEVSNQNSIMKKMDITQAQGVTISRHEYFLTQLNVIRTYLKLLFIPVNQNIDHDYPISHRLDLTTSLTGLFFLLLIILGILKSRSESLMALGILWFFVTLSVESSVIPIGHVMAEYRLYLPSIGMLIFSIYLLSRLDQKLFMSLIFFLIVSASILTIHRNYIWSDEIKLWQDTMIKSPLKRRAYSNLAYLYTVNHKYSEALTILKNEHKLFPLDAEDYINYAYIYKETNDLDSALSNALKAVELEPSNADYHRQAGFIYLKQHRLTEAVNAYANVLKINKNKESAEEYSKIIIHFYLSGKDADKTKEYTQLLKENHFDDLAEYIYSIINQNKF